MPAPEGMNARRDCAVAAGLDPDGSKQPKSRSAVPEADTAWPFVDIRRPGRAGNPGRFIDVDCSTLGGEREVHITGVTDDGRLWHAIRREDSTWKKVFTDVKATAGDKGTFVSVTTADQQIIGATSDGARRAQVQGGRDTP